MEAPADVGHGHPFLYDRHPGDHVLAAQDLRGNKVANLVERQRRRGRITCSTRGAAGPAQSERTSLKCFVVLMMYGVFSFLSFFIQPCPKNSLQGKEIRTEKKKMCSFSLKTNGKEMMTLTHME